MHNKSSTDLLSYPKMLTLLRKDCEKNFGISPYRVSEKKQHLESRLEWTLRGGKNEFPFHIKGSNGLRYHLITEIVNVNELPF